MPLVASSAVLFYAGMAFAYYVVFPLVFGFFTSTAPRRGDGGDRHRQLSGLRTDPVLRVRGGVRNSGGHHTAVLDRGDQSQEPAGEAPLRHRRGVRGRHAVDAARCLSQTLLAIPMWGLWEIGLFFARFYVKEESEEKQEQTEEGAKALPLSCPVRGVW